MIQSIAAFEHVVLSKTMHSEEQKIKLSERIWKSGKSIRSRKKFTNKEEEKKTDMKRITNGVYKMIDISFLNILNSISKFKLRRKKSGVKKEKREREMKEGGREKKRIRRLCFCVAKRKYHHHITHIILRCFIYYTYTYEYIRTRVYTENILHFTY